MHLGVELARYQLLKQRLLTDFSTLDDETLRDTLEGISDLHEMIAAIIRSALVDEALHAGLRFRLDDMKQRLSRLEVRAAKKRQLALEAMSEVGFTKLEQPDFTASARAGSPALIVIAEDKIPNTYWLPQSPKLDRQTMLCELKRGAEIPGAQLSNPQRVLMVMDEVMALSDTQVRQLRAKLEARHVKTRKANGADLHYVEGWHVIAEANRIFGYDAWDRRTLASRCVWSGAEGPYHEAAYTAKVRVTVRAADINIVREGSGSGEAKAPTPGQAHELALKGAETDATKRALATFGNPFGLALYDRERIGVRKARGGKDAPAIGPWILRSASGGEGTSFDQPSAFAAALRQVMSEARDIELLFAVWEQNVETVRALNRSLKQHSLPRSGIAPQLVAHLKHCAVALVKPENRNKGPETTSDPRTHNGGPTKIDKSVLTISEQKRIRSKEHLRFVAQHPCLICGRSPSHAHHVRFAQSRGLGLKVSDEFTVPLCAIHHQQNHATGNERLWWQEHKIDPLAVATRLWRESQRLPASDNESLDGSGP